MILSASLIKQYKACKQAYKFRYVEELVPKDTAQTLVDGTNYHSGIEQIYNQGYADLCDNPKINAMLLAYEKYVYPEFKVQAAEKWFEYSLCDKHKLVGRNDAIATDGLPVEHKTTSSDVDEEYIYNLQWDEQILAYMLANGCNEMYYTVCKKPTIRQKKDEIDEDFFQRCCEWYATDTELKIRVIKVTRTPEEIEEFRQELIRLADEIENCTFFYRNPNWCTHYGRRCEYAPICLNYDPKLEYVEFEHKGRNLNGN